MTQAKSGRERKIPEHLVSRVIDKFYALLNQAISEAQAGKRFPTLQELKFKAGIEINSPVVYPWLRNISEAYQQAKVQVHGPGDWQNQFRNKKTANAGLEIKPLIEQILTHQGPLRLDQIDFHVMRMRGRNRRDLAVTTRAVKSLVIAGKVRNVGAGRYTLAGENTHERS